MVQVKIRLSRPEIWISEEATLVLFLQEPTRQTDSLPNKSALPPMFSNTHQTPDQSPFRFIRPTQALITTFKKWTGMITTKADGQISSPPLRPRIYIHKSSNSSSLQATNNLWEPRKTTLSNLHRRFSRNLTKIITTALILSTNNYRVKISNYLDSESNQAIIQALTLAKAQQSCTPLPAASPLSSSFELRVKFRVKHSVILYMLRHFN